MKKLAPLLLPLALWGCGVDATTTPAGDALDAAGSVDTVTASETAPGNDAVADAPDASDPIDGDTASGEPADAVDPVDGADAALDGADAGHEPLACTPGLAGTGAPVTAVINGFTVSVNPVDGSWSVAPPGTPSPALSGPGTCADGLPALRASVGAPFVLLGFGAFQIRLEGPDAEAQWFPVTGEPPAVALEGAELVARYPSHLGTTLDLRFRPVGALDLGIALETTADVDGGEVLMAASPTEAWFGLGTQVTGMDLRGGVYPLWTQEQGISKPPGGGLFPLANIPEAAYAPMGVLHSSAGWSAVLDTDTYAEVDLGKTREDRLALRTYAHLPALVLVPGATPKERVSAITRYTGRPPLVPAWQLGPWNDAVGGPDRLHEVAALLRVNEIPSSAIWSEDWIGGDQGPNGFRLSYAWAWDPETYPDLPADIQWLHGQGFAFLAYFNPFVPEPTAMWAEGVAGGWLVKDAGGEVYDFLDPAFRNAGLVDLSNPGAREWLKGYLRTAAGTLGIDGWMADFAEWLPHDAVLHDGRSGWEAHNTYPLEWQRANVEAMEDVHGGGPETGWTFFVRSGWASTSGGTAGIAPSLWAGDQNTNWALDDGLPTVLPIAAHVGLCGVSMFGSDIAGYTSVGVPNTTKELFFRWASLGAFHPLMRTHHGSDECGNWSFERDGETLAHYRRMAVLHTLLYPLFAALAAEASATGLPITRHPWLVEPERPALLAGPYQVFLGDDVVVAPVLEEGTVEREVRLPGSGWWPLLGWAPVDGVESGGVYVHMAAAGPAEIPVFVRPGTVLPLLGDPVDSFYGSTDVSVTTLEDVEGRYRAALYPTAQGDAGPATVGSATVAAVDLPAAVDWATATVGGPVAECGSEQPGAHCVDGDTLVVRGPAVVAVGGGTVTVEGPPTQETRLGVGGATFGEWATPTVVTDLDPDIPPPCE
ncbi:MAG: hypothetical protein AMXMBFR64_46200 [Myxococcales bacterium]